MPANNAFSTLMLFGWTPIAQVFFVRFQAPMAAAITLLVGVMVLPERLEFDLPGLPPLDKKNAISLAMLLGGMYACRGRMLAAKPGMNPWDWLAIALALTSVGSVMTNTDALLYGPHYERPLNRTDMISMTFQALIYWGIPFYLGRAFFRTTSELRTLATVMAVAGLSYTLLILVEARLSPHLHKWTYGYHPAPFRNMIRGDGWKPMVYMGSGLAVGQFTATSMIAMASLARSRVKVRGIPFKYFLPYMAVLVLLCRSASSVVYGFTLAPLIYVMPMRVVKIAIVALCTLIFSYPLLRSMDVFPTEPLVEASRMVSDERAFSLYFRFVNEDKLMRKALERPIFGWGIGGRNRIYDEEGRDLSKTDGFWILAIGGRGLIGWALCFGILLFPVLSVVRNIDRIPRKSDQAVAAGLALVVLTYTVDLLPNTIWSPVPVFVSGALAATMGHVKRTAGKAKKSGKSRKARDPNRAGRSLKAPAPSHSSPSLAKQLRG